MVRISVFFSLGAFGYFEVTHDITKYSKAKVFEHIGKRTPIAVRFSTVGKLVYWRDWYGLTQLHLFGDVYNLKKKLLENRKQALLQIMARFYCRRHIWRHTGSYLYFCLLRS